MARSEADQNHEKKSLEHSYRHLPVKSTASSIARKQPQPHQMVIRPTLLDQRYSGIKVFSHKNREGSALHRKGSHKERDEPQDKDDDEVEESSSNNYQSSSSWTSQEVSANGSGGNSSEDHSLQGEIEVSTSGTMVDASYEYSSEECDNNSYTSNDNYNYNSLNSSDSLKSGRYYNKIKPEKKVGGLRKLKNKLGLIFHHHHHHHHYHHDNDDNYDDDGSIDSKRRQRHSMWSNLQNVFHHKNKHHGMITNGSDEKPRRGSVVARVTHKNQVGQFHRLVEGLMGHMRHAKKPKKPHKVAVKGSRNAPHGHRKKNPNWWKMLQQHRGVKVKNRGRVRKEFIGQKSPKMLT
ncbi:protein KOKOPELLI [Arachis stenosperma]|uniref:protein KOKOPELLI n=1 Tax=Arachis stenosperma TaxID=217475 RepID=UPI0025AB71BB|nr:protein KOKOPELLI [Arachis stenosperma]